MTDFADLARGRRSIGKVRAEPVERDTVHGLLELATWAPTHHMREPWRFVVLEGAAREAAGRAHAAAFTRARPDADDAALRREVDRFTRAPVVIVAVCHCPDDDPVLRREDRDAVAAAVQNLLLGAHDHGLGAMWRTGTMPDEPDLRDHLGLDDRDEIVAFVYLGVPDMEPPLRSRRPVDEVTVWRTS